MKAVGYITKKVLTISYRAHGYTRQVKAITHRLYYHGDKIGNVRVVLAFEES